MAQTIAFLEKKLAHNYNRRILCCYVNDTSKLQIIRIKNIPDFRWERVVFPGQRLMFEALSEAKLEISSSEFVTLLLPCNKLRVTENSRETTS